MRQVGCRVPSEALLQICNLAAKPQKSAIFSEDMPCKNGLNADRARHWNYMARPDVKRCSLPGGSKLGSAPRLSLPCSTLTEGAWFYGIPLHQRCRPLRVACLGMDLRRT